MKYYKIENGNKTYVGSSIVVDDKQVINPTVAILLSAGYVAESEELTDAEKLQQAISKKIAEIEAYSESDNVNSLTYNGVQTWLTPAIRSNYLTSISSAELLGETSITFAIAGQAVTVPLQNAKILLAKIQRYADACFLVTQQHKIAVNSLTTIEAVENFDYKTGYPEKLKF